MISYILFGNTMISYILIFFLRIMLPVAEKIQVPSKVVASRKQIHEALAQLLNSSHHLKEQTTCNFGFTIIYKRKHYYMKHTKYLSFYSFPLDNLAQLDTYKQIVKHVRPVSTNPLWRIHQDHPFEDINRERQRKLRVTK